MPERPDPLRPWFRAPLRFGLVRRAELLGVAAAALGACTGAIFEPRAPLDSPPTAAPECAGVPAVGRTGLHRLSNLEYDRTVEALLGDGSRPAQHFPSDVASRFDHVTDVQSVSPLHGARYEEAADVLAATLWRREFDVGFTRRFEAEQNAPDSGLEVVQAVVPFDLTSGGARIFYNAYRIYVLTDLDVAGDYEVRFEAWSNRFPTGGEPLPDGGFRNVLWRVQFDHQTVFATNTQGTATSPATHRATVHVEAPGVHRIDLYAADPQDVENCGPDAGPVGCEASDPELGRVDALWVSRASTRVPEAEHRVRVCELSLGEPCVRQSLAALLRRAYRRPPSSEELERYVELHAAAQAAGDSMADAFSQTVSAVLLSPHFLFHVQLDPDPLSTEPHRLSAHELATRLSYFLTRAPPDAELAAQADEGALLEEEVLLAQTQRLLATAAHDEMTKSFATQVVGNRDFAQATPNPQLFPGFTPELKASMAHEAELLFTDVFRASRPLVELADARYTFLDDTLAAHYQLPAPHSSTPVRVQLDTGERGGLLGLGSVLTLTSTPSRPSQVRRGVWVLGRLWCDEPPAPPQSIPSLPENGGAEGLSAHTSNPACTHCHRVIDPIGFALDRYDADGSRRSVDRQGRPLAARGTLPDGTEVVDLLGIRAAVKADPRFEACMAEHLFAYALARVPSRDDACAAAALPAVAGGRGQASYMAVLRALVQSDAFRSRQAEGVVDP